MSVQTASRKPESWLTMMLDTPCKHATAKPQQRSRNRQTRQTPESSLWRYESKHSLRFAHPFLSFSVPSADCLENVEQCIRPKLITATFEVHSSNPDLKSKHKGGLQSAWATERAPYLDGSQVVDEPRHVGDVHVIGRLVQQLRPTEHHVSSDRSAKAQFTKLPIQQSLGHTNGTQGPTCEKGALMEDNMQLECLVQKRAWQRE